MLIQSFSGIRGIYNKDLTEDAARRYAYVFSEFLRKKLKREPLVVVGYDTRQSNIILKNAVFDSLFNIIDVGIIPIAAIQLGVREYKADGGIAITASHNPPEYNGFKFLDKDGAVIRPKDAALIIGEFSRISRLSEREFMDKCLYRKELGGRIKKVVKANMELIHKYSSFLKKQVGNIKNKSKIILDVNGGTGIILKEVIAGLKLQNVKMLNTQRGKFIREIEPSEGSLKYLKGIIKKENAEFAAGFDCDADRIAIVLSDGSFVNGNYILALIADGILSRKKGAVVVNDATSALIRRIAEKHNCGVKEVEVGEINVVEEMLRLKSPVGGEGSNGGIIIPPSRCRDGMLSVLYLLKMINERGKSLRDLIEGLPKYHNLQTKVVLKSRTDNKAMRERIKDYYSDKGYAIKERGGITGSLKIIIDNDSFVWLRASKTEQNLLRVIADSDSEAECRNLLNEAVSLFRKQQAL